MRTIGTDNVLIGHQASYGGSGNAAIGYVAGSFPPVRACPRRQVGDCRFCGSAVNHERDACRFCGAAYRKGDFR